MTKHYLYGYKLSHADGSQSRWQFMNDNDIILTIRIKLTTGVNHFFSEEVDFVHNWAANRELKVEQCQYIFDADHMSFVQMSK